MELDRDDVIRARKRAISFISFCFFGVIFYVVAQTIDLKSEAWNMEFSAVDIIE